MLSPLSPLLAFGLQNLPMLGWLAAAAAPILIHLWSRRKFRETTWAAMEYLLAAVQRRARRLHVEQLLLLALRTLLIVLVVLAVAEPLAERAGAVAAGGRTHRVLVIDASYSMAYRHGDRTRFDAAKQLARQIVERSPQGDAFTLVAMASPPRAVIATPALAASEVVQELDALPLAHTAFDLPATVALARQLIVKARQETPRLNRHEVLFVTDLCRVGWHPDLPARAAAEFRRQTAELAEQASLVVMDVSQPASENLAVSGLRCADAAVTAGQAVAFEAAVANFGRQARSGQAVELFVDRRRVDRRTVEVPPGGTASVGLSHRFDAPGEHVVEVRAEGDALEVDNRRWLAVPVREAIETLCVDGRPAGEPFRGAADYLACALAPPSSSGTAATVRTEVVPESAVLERDLSRYDCVFLCSVAQCTTAEARVLAAYLEHGGSLVLFLGEGVLPDRYNRELGEGPGAILPARIGPAAADAPQRLDALDFRHPIMQAFRGRGQTALLTAPVLKHHRLTMPERTAARVVLAMSNGDPLIVEGPAGRGRVIVVATSADTAWTPLPLWPSYVPLVQEMLSFCVAGQARQRNVTVGEPIGAALPAAAGPQPPNVIGPDDRPRTAQVSTDGPTAAWTCADTLQSGIYQVHVGPAPQRSQCFAANLDVAESDLTPLGVERLRDEVWPGIAFAHQTSWTAGGELAPVAVAASGSRLGAPLLAVALALLLFETYLAWRFGYHGT